MIKNRILIVGLGSMGERHLQNLQLLGCTELAICESDLQRRTRFNGQTFERYTDALKIFKPHIVFICSPTSLHVRQALEAARAGCHLFIEKPLSHSLDNVDELMAEVKKRMLINMVACNMRFHPGPMIIKALIDDGHIGDVLSTRISTGSYLPRWKRERPYKETYSADRKEGGAALDCIHEIDLVFWYLGPGSIIGSASLPASNIDLPNVDGLHEVILRHASGALSSIHLNFIQQDKRRTQVIIGTKGTIYWEYRGLEDQKIELYGPDGTLKKTLLQDEKFDVNDMYAHEVRHFLECIEGHKQTCCPLAEGKAALTMALTIR